MRAKLETKDNYEEIYAARSPCSFLDTILPFEGIVGEKLGECEEDVDAIVQDVFNMWEDLLNLDLQSFLEDLYGAGKLFIEI